MKSKIFTSIILSALCVILAGCGNNTVSRVKATAWDGSPSLTTGQALDNLKVCTSTSWKTLTDDRGRLIAEYDCSFNNSAVPSNDPAQSITAVTLEIQWVIPSGDNASAEPVMSFFGTNYAFADGHTTEGHYLNIPAVTRTVTENTAVDQQSFNTALRNTERSMLIDRGGF